MSELSFRLQAALFDKKSAAILLALLMALIMQFYVKSHESLDVAANIKVREIESPSDIPPPPLTAKSTEPVDGAKIELLGSFKKVSRSRRELLMNSTLLGKGVKLTPEICGSLELTQEEAELADSAIQNQFAEQIREEQRSAELVQGEDGPYLKISPLYNRDTIHAELTNRLKSVLGDERGEELSSLLKQELFFGTSDCTMELYFTAAHDGTMLRTVGLKNGAIDSQLSANDSLYPVLTQRFPYWEQLALTLSDKE